MMELKTTSSQEGSEPLLEKEICERVLGKRLGEVKEQDWRPRPKSARNEAIQQAPEKQMHRLHTCKV